MRLPVRQHHEVFFYRDPMSLADAVIRHISPALEELSPTILIMTRPNEKALELQLRRTDFDPEILESMSLLTRLNAEETLEKFYIGGALNEPIFRKEIGGLIERTQFPTRLTFAYGEMVDVLCSRKKYEHALELEAMWNRLGVDFKFALLCGYDLTRTTPTDFIKGACNRHDEIDYEEPLAQIVREARAAQY